jgi:hypothetical protein
MRVEILTLCDAATDSQNKLSMLGAFDTITAPAFPVTHPHCAIALRLRFTRIEEGEHAIRIHVVDEDGELIMPSLDGRLSVELGPGNETASVNFILGIQELPLDRPGTYAVTLAVDGREEASVPLYVKQVASAGAN